MKRPVLPISFCSTFRQEHLMSVMQFTVTKQRYQRSVVAVPITDATRLLPTHK
jgi:hypothetical protein